MPVMEGKAMLFKEFAQVDAFPICLDTQDPEEIIKAVELIAPTFGGINLEDISAPRCFEIEDRLKETLDIPVFHDDQHGTAIVTMAALFNALKIVGKPIEQLRVLMVGLGAAGVAVTKMMLASGVTHIVGCDRQGALSTTRADYESGEMSGIKRWYAENSNPEQLSGGPNEVIEGMDLFIGLSGPGLIEADSLAKMNDDAIVFAMANPTPEVMPEDAAPYVRIMATGRSDYPNQINNVLAFPGIFRGALDAGAPQHHRGDEARRRQGHRRWPSPRTTSPRTTSSPASSTAKSRRRSPKPWSRRQSARGSPASTRRPAPSRRWRSPSSVKVLVTGASGFIGSALCDSLLVRGDTVVGLTRDPSRRAATNPSVNWHAWEPTLERPPGGGLRGRRRRRQPARREDQPALDRRGQRADHGEPPHRHPQPGRHDRRPASTSRRCWSASRRSATTATAARRSSTSRREPGEGFDAEVVREWEKAAHEVEATGVRLAIVRTGHVLDPRGGFLEQLLTPFKLGVGGPLAGGDQYVSWIHVDDEVGILLWALDNEKVNGVVNATAPQPGDQQGLLEGAGQGARPAGGGAGAGLDGGPDVRQRVRAGSAGRAAGDAPAGAGPRVPVQAPRAGRGAGRLF